MRTIDTETAGVTLLGICIPPILFTVTGDVFACFYGSESVLWGAAVSCLILMGAGMYLPLFQPKRFRMDLMFLTIFLVFLVINRINMGAWERFPFLVLILLACIFLIPAVFLGRILLPDDCAAATEEDRTRIHRRFLLGVSSIAGGCIFQYLLYELVSSLLCQRLILLSVLLLLTGWCLVEVWHRKLSNWIKAFSCFLVVIGCLFVFYAWFTIPQYDFFSPFGHLRISELSQGRWAFQKNNRRIYDLPRVLEQELPHVLAAALQPGQPEISVLVIGSEFSGSVASFLSLQCVKHVTLLSEDLPPSASRSLERLRLYPKDEPRFTLIGNNAVSTLASKKNSYDLIYVEAPLPYNLAENRFFTLDFFELAAACLKAGGTFAVNLQNDGRTEDMSTLSEVAGEIFVNLERRFHYVNVLEKGSLLFLAGNSCNLTADTGVLDQRLLELLPDQDFPDSMMRVMYPEAIRDASWKRVDQGALLAAGNGMENPHLPDYLWRKMLLKQNYVLWDWGFCFLDFLRVWGGWLLGGGLSVYLFLRYFLPRRTLQKTSFLLFESGVYSSFSLMALFWVYQTRLGSVLGDAPLALGVFLLAYSVGAGGRVRIMDPYLKVLSAPVSVAVLLLPTPCLIACQWWILSVVLLLTGYTGGLVHRDLLATGGDWTVCQIRRLYGSEMLGLLAGILFLVMQVDSPKVLIGIGGIAGIFRSFRGFRKES